MTFRPTLRVFFTEDELIESLKRPPSYSTFRRLRVAEGERVRFKDWLMFEGDIGVREMLSRVEWPGPKLVRWHFDESNKG